MKIALLLSGGVDSSVSLRLLKQAGHDVTAFYVKIWLEDELKYLGECPWEDDLTYARAVCAQADVSLKVISLQKEYWKAVVSYTLKELKAGRTPNPDVLCNQRIKFGEFYKKIPLAPFNKGGAGGFFDKVATGHYAEVVIKKDVAYLKMSPDPIKDQTYFLCHLSQAQLSRALFPVGPLEKKEVRALAKKFDLPNKDREDSQGICFLGQVRFRDFVKHYLGEKKGDLIDIDTGEKVGEHQGYWYFTIGQRQGIGLSGGPWYVVRKDTKKNAIYISREAAKGEQLTKQFKVSQITWISGGSPIKRTLRVRIRHGGELMLATLTLHRDKTATVQLTKVAKGVAPGQFAAFYDGKYCLGGGMIK